MFFPRSSCPTLLSVILFGALMTGPVVAKQPPPAPADSLLHGAEEMVVSGQAPADTPAGTVRVPAVQLRWRNPGSLAEVGALLPAVSVAVNSRGESTLMIRGAPERHVQTYLDGIPLNLAWDERVDLETVPITGMGRLESTRGIPSLLAGPGALAGSVRILPPRLDGRRHSRLDLSLGSRSRVRASLMDQRRLGAWDLLSGGGWQSRNTLPHPDGGDVFNTDMKQISGLLRAGRPVAGTGRLNLLASVWGGEKGVQPEAHEGDDARFWRYPLRRRLLLGGSLHLPLDHGRWDLNTMLAGDLFNQEIDARGPDGWDRPLENGQKYEKDFDRAASGAAGLTRWLGHGGRLSLQTTWRYNQHRESTRVGGGVQSFAQLLGSVVLEGEVLTHQGWRLRGGLGWDTAATPESGDKPGAADFSAAARQVRLSREWYGQRSGHGTAYASYARRSRFPSLRELYSGALDEFVPNPGLQPEEQEIFELGWTLDRPAWSLFGALFHQMLHGGIEKERLADRPEQFMRVNRTRIRVPGCELGLNWRPLHPLELSLRYTLLEARVETATGFDRPAEDRPDYLARLGLSWQRETGPGALLEVETTGARHSADSTDAATGLRRLGADTLLNLRLSWRWLPDATGASGSDAPRQVEAFVRVNNLLDETAYFQTGLIEPGRVLILGAGVGY